MHGDDLEPVRRAVETALQDLDPAVPVDLLGTSIEGGILRVVVRSRRDGSVHVIRREWR